MIENGSKYTVVDLFSGAGGFTIGFTQADFKILLSTDFDSDCAKAHEKNMPTIPFLHSDIYNISEEVIDKYVTTDVDVLIGGPPCQGFSTIGARATAKNKGRVFRHS